jgi:polygalacturonase
MINEINIKEYGVREGLVATEGIQKAFDKANELGNGTVVIPKGTFYTGTINMGNASLYLEKGAILKGSANPEDYYENGFVHNEMRKCISLLYSQNSDGIKIAGEGTIDFNGSAFYDYDVREIPDFGMGLSPEQEKECTATYDFRPTQPMFFHQCKNIVLEDITLCNAPCWTMSFHDCENIRIQNLLIDNDPVIPNNDGMHFCGCRRVFITGCNITSGDDCIALTSITDWNKACEDFIISDCILCSSSKALVLGYMHSIIRNICISNCIIRDSHRGFCIMTSTNTGLIEHVIIENVRIDTRVRAGNWWGNGEPICIFALHHDNPHYLNPAPIRAWDTNIRDIRLRNISCSGENVIGIVGAAGNISEIALDGIYYERKKSKNSCLKGSNKIDVSPAQEVITLPEGPLSYWIHIQGCKNVKVSNASIQDFYGKELTSSVVDCEKVTISS